MDVAAHRLESPGSTVKPFVLMTLLESGRLDPQKKLLCHRPLWIGAVRMDCTHPEDVTQLDASEAIAYSCNSYVAQAAVRFDADEVVQLYRRLGFDSASGLAEGEATGRIERAGTREDMELEALGHRGVEVTPLELLEAYRKLALRVRRGRMADADAPVLAGLEGSVEFGMGLAAHVDGMKIAGKTGTSEAPGRPRRTDFLWAMRRRRSRRLPLWCTSSEGTAAMRRRWRGRCWQRSRSIRDHLENRARVRGSKRQAQGVPPGAPHLRVGILAAWSVIHALLPSAARAQDVRVGLFTLHPPAAATIRAVER